ncbi:hypothetical protein [Streptomyces sp. NPDC051001]|uniref:hypothetical protein n=1 Tax=Streptomyces sp. NPDC051001 TaxID=3155795 RepID=UPI00341397FE
MWERCETRQRRELLSAAVVCVWVTKADGQGRRFDAAKRLRIVWVEERPAE